ncbi:MAG: SLATT domain-containing protein [Anaerolineaceae bacterium]|nr:SLATT domain-containing protein [Anaerolineaceae bacterium]
MSDADTNTTEQQQAADPTIDFKQQGFDRDDVDVLYRIYIKKRLDSQAGFYKSRVRENNSNANFTFLVSTAVMSISALVAAVSAVVSSPFFSLLSAILPAFAALLAAFRQLYGWERQSSIYQDALMGLERVKLLTPDKDEMPTADLTTIYPSIVMGGEEVFTGEVNQWGQYVQNADKNAQEESNDTRITNALMGDLQLSEEQIATMRKIVAAATSRPSFSQHTITVDPEERGALPAGVSNTEQEAVTTSHIDDQTFQSADAPTAVTTTHTESTVEEHVVPPVESSEAAASAQAVETQASASEPQEPAPEEMTALTPGAEHVAAPQGSEEIDALMNHQEAANEPPPPEAVSSLTPGAMHVDAPQAPPENPDLEKDPNANG